MASALTATQPHPQVQLPAAPFFLPTAWYAFIVKRLAPKYYDDSVCRMAEVCQLRLKALPRMNLETAAKHPAVHEGRFLKKIASQSSDPRIKALSKELLAAKLGLQSAVMDQHPGFEEFASKTHLDGMLRTFKHDWPVGQQEIRVKSHGMVKPWSEAQKDIQEKQATNGDPSIPWLYGKDGIQNKDYYRWTTFEPFNRQDPKQWGNQYIFELCIFMGEYPGCRGDHVWFRLKTDQGDIYSAGLYDWDKSHNNSVNLSVKHGTVQSPDISEVWPGKVHTLAWKTTAENFAETKKQVELFKELDGELFHLFGCNCPLYTVRMAALNGLKISVQTTILKVFLAMRLGRILIPGPLQDVVSRVLAPLPKIVVVVITYPLLVILNIFQLVLGAGQIDPQAAQKRKEAAEKAAKIAPELADEFNKPVEPHFKHWWQVFDPSKCEFTHPLALIQTTFREIKEWRAREIAKLEATKAQLQFTDPQLIAEIDRAIKEVIPYALPPKN